MNISLSIYGAMEEGARIPSKFCCLTLVKAILRGGCKVCLNQLVRRTRKLYKHRQIGLGEVDGRGVGRGEEEREKGGKERERERERSRDEGEGIRYSRE